MARPPPQRPGLSLVGVASTLFYQPDMSALDSDRLNALATPSYVIAAILIVIPLVDTALALLPLRPGELAWRFGALGLGSQALMTPLLGGLLALVTATVFGHRRGLRVVQIVAWLAAVLLVVAIALFLLDAIQMRASVRPEVKGAFDKASAVALVKYFVGAAIAVIFAMASQRAIKRTRTATASGADQPPLVFGASTTKA